MAITNMQRIEIVRACCCVASADGSITSEERDHLRKLAEAIGIGSASLNAMIDRAMRDKEFYRQQFGTLRDDPLVTLDILVEAARAAGPVTEPELKMLWGLANQLGISQQDFAQRIEQALKQK
jgi:uncharacterized tellurite resistance protein B-like protein